MAAKWWVPLMLLAAGMAQAGEVKAESANSGTAQPAAGTDEPVGILEISERREYYVVDATTHDELRQQLDAAMAGHGEGKSVGRTEQDLRSAYELVATPEGCRFKDLVVSLDISIHLPSWQPANGKRPYKLDKAWEKMIAALTLHEEGHRDIAVETAGFLLDSLRALPAHLDCGQLREQAGKAFFRARVRHSIVDGIYDRRTRHGIAQGAVL